MSYEWTPDRNSWSRKSAAIDADDVSRLLAQGAECWVLWCDGPVQNGDDLDAHTLKKSILRRIAGPKRLAKLMKRRSTPSVFVAEEWIQAPSGAKMIVVVEGPPVERLVNNG